MRKRFRGASLVAIATWTLASCTSTPRNAAAPVPEAEQVIREAIKDLYLAASAAAPQSAAQQKVILSMARKATNGKELLLTTRAALGVGPDTESQVRSIVTAKMMQFGTLHQLIDYSTQYSVDPQSARAFVQRMFQLGEGQSDPRAWYLIRVAANHLKMSDLGRQAQTRGDQLASR